MQLAHLASRLYGTPLLLDRSKLDIILGVLGQRIAWPDSHAALALPVPNKTPSHTTGNIAVIAIHGSLVRRALGLDAASGLTAYADIAAELDAAVSDPTIAGILLDIDSPGGEAGGVFELAERIRAASARKPLWAIANDAAFSAGYALACAASKLFITRTGGVGSIGVIAMHVDQSSRDAQDGLRYTALTAGSHKNDYSPHAPLSSDAAQRLQREVDRLYGLFIAHVAAMRELSATQIEATEAGLYFGTDALAQGLADAVSDIDSVLAEFSAFLSQIARPLKPSPSRTALTQELIPMPELTPESAAPNETKVEPDIASALAATRSEMQAIAELCLLAGHPEHIAGFFAEGLSAVQVRGRLLSARAQSPEIQSYLAPEAKPADDALGNNPLIKAVQKRAGLSR